MPFAPGPSYVPPGGVPAPARHGPEDVWWAGLLYVDDDAARRILAGHRGLVGSRKPNGVIGFMSAASADVDVLEMGHRVKNDLREENDPETDWIREDAIIKRAVEAIGVETLFVDWIESQYDAWIEEPM